MNLFGFWPLNYTSMRGERIQLLLCLVVIALTGCSGLEDDVLNLTKSPIYLRVTDTDGREFLGEHGGVIEGRIFLKPNEGFTTFRSGRRLQHIEVFDAAGKLIGSFDKEQVPNKRGRYGHYLAFVVLDSGVYPVPKRDFSRKSPVDKESLEKVLRQEREYESRTSRR